MRPPVPHVYVPPSPAERRARAEERVRARRAALAAAQATTSAALTAWYAAGAVDHDDPALRAAERAEDRAEQALDAALAARADLDAPPVGRQS